MLRLNSRGSPIRPDATVNVRRARGKLPGGRAGRARDGRDGAAACAGQRVDVYGIYFDFNSDRIRKESDPILQEIAEMLRRHPDWTLGVPVTPTMSAAMPTTSSSPAAAARRSARRSWSASASPRALAFGRPRRGRAEGHERDPRGASRNRRVELVRS